MLSRNGMLFNHDGVSDVEEGSDGDMIHQLRQRRRSGRRVGMGSHGSGSCQKEVSIGERRLVGTRDVQVGPSDREGLWAGQRVSVRVSDSSFMASFGHARHQDCDGRGGRILQAWMTKIWKSSTAKAMPGMRDSQQGSARVRERSAISPDVDKERKWLSCSRHRQCSLALLHWKCGLVKPPQNSTDADWKVPERLDLPSKISTPCGETFPASRAAFASSKASSCTEDC
jgi:hypothetical protein